jgi:hypothetical protein
MDALQFILTEHGEGGRETTGNKIIHLELIKENSLKFWTKKSEKVLLAIICGNPEDSVSSSHEESDSMDSHSLVDGDLAERQRRPYPSSHRVTMPNRASNRPPLMYRSTAPAQPLPPSARMTSPPSPPPAPRPFYAPPPPPAAMQNSTRPPPPPGVRFPGPPPQLQPPQQGAYFPQQPPLQANIARVQDVTPLKPITEADCAKILTIYGAWTIQKVISLEDMQDNSSKSWLQCTIRKEPLGSAEIIERVEDLDNDKLPIIQKKLALQPDQQQQVSRLLADVALEERDRNYEWHLR